MSTSEIRTCTSCGAVYERRTEKLIFRDKDDVSCRCGEVLERYNGSRVPVYKLIKEGTKPQEP